MLFKLIGGTHVGPPGEDGVRKVYKKGDLVRSDEDLTEKFQGKFQKDFREHAAPVEILKPNIPTPGDAVAGEGDTTEPASPEPVTPSKVKSVAEVDEEPTEPDPPIEPQVLANPEPAKSEEPTPSQEPAPAEESKYGKKVNEDFKLADVVEIDVFKDKASWYTCVDRDDGEVLNDKKLRKKDVPAFLKKYIEE